VDPQGEKEAGKVIIKYSFDSLIERQGSNRDAEEEYHEAIRML
jgi:hypothetical protein